MNATSLSFRHPSFQGLIGLARADVTPPIGVYARNWGAATHDCAESIHRPLTLTAMVITDEDRRNKLVLLEGDLSWWRGLGTWHRFRDSLLDAARVPPAALMFSLTHTHAAPPLMQPDPDLPGGELLQQWLESLLATATRLVRQADRQCQPARMEWHRGSCRLAHSRDLREPNANPPRHVCGFDPTRTADDTLLVGRVTTSDDRVLAVLVNYACHPTTLAFENRAVSPDFVGAMRKVIQQDCDGGLALFLQGASGELAPRYQYVGDPAVADRHGRQLGHAVLATLADMEPPGTGLHYAGAIESGAPLAIWKHGRHSSPGQVRATSRTASIPIKDWPSTAELEQRLQSCDDRALEERWRRRLAIRRAVGDSASFELPLSIWRTGDIVWAGSMAESYSVLQRSLRERFPHSTVICMNLVNGSIGYLPPAELYDSDIYQVWQTPFNRGSLEAVIEEMACGIQQLLEA